MMALAFTVVFAVLARVIRGVSATGAVAGALVSFVLYVSFGAGAFIALVSVFVLAWLTTRLGYARKEQRGTAERTDGRTASQVLANLGLAAVAGLLYASTGKPIFMVAIAAVLGEACADTVSSEYGQAWSDKAVLITTWEDVSAGTDGGISAAGTVAGATAAAMIGTVCAGVGLLTWKRFWIPTAAAILGMVVDSFLGAALERRKILGNDGVNFLSTLVAAVIASLFFKFFG